MKTSTAHRGRMTKISHRLVIEPLEPRAMLTFGPVGPDFIVSENSEGLQAAASVGMNGQGNFVIVWLDMPEDRSSSDIMAQRFDRAGIPYGPEFQVNSLDHHPELPAMAMRDSGEFIVVWASNSRFVDPTGDPPSDIYARWFEADGTPLGPEFVVNDVAQDPGNTIAEHDPAVAVAADGSFTIT